jgi:hypothetical protein
MCRKFQLTSASTCEMVAAAICWTSARIKPTKTGPILSLRNFAHPLRQSVIATMILTLRLHTNRVKHRSRLAHGTSTAISGPKGEKDLDEPRQDLVASS